MTAEQPVWRPLEGYEEFPADEMKRRSAEFLALMKRRRSVREYDQRPVPKEVIEDALAADPPKPIRAATIHVERAGHLLETNQVEEGLAAYEAALELLADQAAKWGKAVWAFTIEMPVARVPAAALVLVAAGRLLGGPGGQVAVIGEVQRVRPLPAVPRRDRRRESLAAAVAGPARTGHKLASTGPREQRLPTRTGARAERRYSSQHSVSPGERSDERQRLPRRRSPPPR